MLTCPRADVEDAAQLIDAKAETLFFEGMVSTTPVQCLVVSQNSTLLVLASNYEFAISRILDVV